MPPDDMDRVQERVDLHLARAIEAQRPRGEGLLECEEEIPERRRQVAPWARCCVRCQQIREARR